MKPIQRNAYAQPTTGGPVLEEINENDIAIIGMAARLPQAKSVKEFWSNLRSGLDLIGELPASRRGDIESYTGLYHDKGKKPNYPPAAYLHRIDTFDFSFFQLSPRLAALMDPHHRIFLETAWEAIEDAGYGGDRIRTCSTGVFAGFNPRLEYRRMIADTDPASLADSLAGNLPSLLGSLIAHTLDLQGPNMTVNTACSSSLVAVHLACQALRGRECDMALVGGIRLSLLPHEDVEGADIGIVSSTGRAKVFDNSTDGSGGGEGSIALLLKPLGAALDDNDLIHAVIKGSAVNNDGRSASLAAPNPLAQEKVIRKAWEQAGVHPETISYIEAHGTGTLLGDPIEIEGITRAFRSYTARKQFCAVGSVKSNMGHLDTAAGLAGMLKCILSLKHHEIPASLHVELPNKNIDFESSPVFVNRHLSAWEAGAGPRRCGVTSLGLSGTNVHVVLEEAPEQDVLPCYDSEKKRIVGLSARTPEALRTLTERYISLLTEDEEIDVDDLCYTANTGRNHYSWRVAVLFTSCSELRTKLQLIDWMHPVSLPSEGIFITSRHGGNEPIATSSQLGGIRKSDPAKGWIYAGIEEIGSANVLEDDLTELGERYIEGKTIDWKLLYEGQGRRKISLPTYPFAPTRCWLALDNVGVDSGLRGSADLIEKELARENLPEQALATVEKSKRAFRSVELTGSRRDRPILSEELCIAEVWGRLLGYDKLGIHDNYYSLGGDSILALRIVNTLNEELGTTLNVADILQQPTIESLATLVRAKMVSPAAIIHRSIEHAPKQGDYPLSSSQRRLYLVEQLEGPTIKYNLPHLAVLEGPLDPERFARAVRTLLARHEALRTSFAFRDGHPVQRVHEHVASPLTFQEASDISLASLLASFVQPFDLGCAPLLRLTLIRQAEDRHLLVYDIHHIIYDGVSIGILIQDLLAFYREETLAALPIQYKDYAFWQQERLRSGEMRA
ncbi:beta-ketoacyl synthase N-terminal-like domain-containing protein, partial [Paenibacillus massiliensis]|uniref:beta-ketoacyl synthase N-terminal-like domain-containing protein n=1 Tax=Paenibacillus massiliensis TaxID=225917 RepID=UPI0006846FBF